MPTLRKQYVDGGYGQVHVRVSAPDGKPESPPLYCLHQSPKNGKEFERFMAAASAAPHNRLCIAIDYPGYGMSDAPPSEDDASIELYARTAWQVADALGHSKIDLFGNHTGGKVATEMALQRGDAVGNIVIVSAAILTDEERAEYRDYFTPIPLDPEGTRFSTMWQRIYDVRGPGQHLELLSDSFAMNLMGGEAYEWGHVAAFNYGKPFEEALKKLPHHITLLNPADTLNEVTKRAEAMLNNGEMVDLPDWGYGFMDIWPEETAQLVVSKLS